MEAAKDKIRKQVEFYFSDSNIVRDAFLKSKVESTEGGWVPAALLASFKRVKEMLKAGGVADDAAAAFVCDAVQGAPGLEVDAGAQQVRRTAPIPETTDADARTVYVKGWPREPEPTIEAVAAFYAAQGAQVLCVRLRRSEFGRYRGHFKGTLTVELATREQAADLLARKPRPDGGAEEMVYQDYATFAAEKEREQAERAAARAARAPEDGPAAKRARRDEDGADGVTVTERPEPRKAVPNSVVRITGMPANIRGKELKVCAVPFSLFSHCCVLLCDDIIMTTWVTSQMELLKIAEVLFVEIEGDAAAVAAKKPEGEGEGEGEEKKAEEATPEGEGEKKAEEAAPAEQKPEVVSVIARCKDERNSSKLVEELNEKGFRDAKVHAVLLQGDEEKAFWDKALAAMNAAESAYNSHSHRGRGGRRGGRGGRRGGRQ